MPINTVFKLGNKQLSTPSLPVKNFKNSNIKKIIEDMHDTMKGKGGVGIAAPQIGYPFRIIMLGFDHNKRYPNEKAVPFTIIINPIITKFSKEIIDGWEACLSVPGLRGLIPRSKQINFVGHNENGIPISGSADGFHARIIQHECDHLDGILFPERIKNMKYFGFEDELAL